MEQTRRQSSQPWLRQPNPRCTRQELRDFNIHCFSVSVSILLTVTDCCFLYSTKWEPTFRWNPPRPVKERSNQWWTQRGMWVSVLVLFHDIVQTVKGRGCNTEDMHVMSLCLGVISTVTVCHHAFTWNKQLKLLCYWLHRLKKDSGATFYRAQTNKHRSSKVKWYFIRLC